MNRAISTENAARIASARVLHRDGVPIATGVSGEVELLVTWDAHGQQHVMRVLSPDPALRLR